jgi:Protein of unknown function (DUF2934)
VVIHEDGWKEAEVERRTRGHTARRSRENEESTGNPVFNKAQSIVAKLGNAGDYRRAISGAMKRRAYEIYERQGCRPGRDKENWRLAEREILPPLACGILKSNRNVIIDFSESVFGAEKIEKVEVCVEPHRLILVGKRRLGANSGESTNF